MPVTPLVRDYADAAVVITGGSTGIGLASALRFVDSGVRRVALLGRNPERGKAARAAVESRCPEAEVVFVRVDANEVPQVERAVAEVHRALGSIDVLVNSTPPPSRYGPELLHRTPLADVAPILATLAVPPMHMTRAVFPVMREQGGGSIVNIASDAAKIATPGESVIGAALAAIVMFSRTAAIEGKRDGIRVNAVTPSLVVGTPLADRVLADGFGKKIFEKAARLAHLGVAEPDDLASLIVFLGGPGAARLTGQAISVTGGISAA
ncbi:SDR family oxidoreductase [Streptomyces brasiliscabiei]|uniref:SDR family oxidoreductase n=1 Tax=Streptomyces brasiliscabiei TaxID=2736302 RepID=A0ABU8G303_9ACTN